MIQTVVFPTLALPKRQGSQTLWCGEIHGWCHSPNTRQRLTQAAMRVFKKSFGLKGPMTKVFRERTSLFLTENHEGLHFECHLLDKIFYSQRSRANGHFFAPFQLTSLHPIQSPLSVEVHLKGKNLEGLGHGKVFLVPDTDATSVLCDIDDTLRVSYVHDTRKLLEHTLEKPLEPIQEMLTLLQRFQNQGATFHYVTASPWQTYPFLSDFFREHQVPPGTFHMKDFRWKDSTFFNLFKPQQEYKLSKLRPILKAFKKRNFILIGDSGEVDLEIYLKLTLEFPKRVSAIVIRNVPEKPLEDSRIQKAYSRLAQFSPHATLTRKGTLSVIALSKTDTTSFSI